ncbi:transposase-like protein [Pseudorhodobacter sp. 4114]|nr:transposase-like protein [Pseudorhodobacter sp. 4114]
MKTRRCTEAQTIAILRQAEGGVPVAELCREHGVSDATVQREGDPGFVLIRPPTLDHP